MKSSLTDPPMSVCPECAEPITFQKKPPLYHLLLCPNCETILMVTAVAPLKLDWAIEEPLSPGEWLTYLSDGSPYWQSPNKYR